ncbi:MAG: LuxR C-terminal-related transcriptional regulator [Solirubrobacteraceae bacterium]
MKQLVIVADHSFTARSIRLALRYTAGFRLAGFLDARRPLLPMLTGMRPDIVVIDDGGQSDQVLARVKEAAEGGGGAKTVLLTLRKDADWLEDAFRAGTDVILSKATPPASLGTLLREIACDNVIHRYRRTPPVAANLPCQLTDRELEILRLVAEGHTNGRIASQLCVSEQTVKFHLSNTYRKIGVSNRTEASRYAHVNDLLEQRAASSARQAA